MNASPGCLIPDLDPRAELVLLARSLARHVRNDPGAGTITVNRFDGTFLCNPFNLLWEELRVEDILRIDETGAVVEGRWPVSPGMSLNLALHRHRSVGVIMHSHTFYGTMWADMREVPPAMDQACAIAGGTVALVEEYGSGVDPKAEEEALIRKIGDADLALLTGHGVIVTADAVKQVFERSMALELRCERAWGIRAAGGTLVSPIPAALVDRWTRSPGNRGYWEAMVRVELRADPTLLVAQGA